MLYSLSDPSPNYAHLPRLNQYTSTRSEKNHPTRIFVVVNEVEQDDQLDKHIRNDLKSHINSLVGCEIRKIIKNRSGKEISIQFDLGDIKTVSPNGHPDHFLLLTPVRHIRFERKHLKSRQRLPLISVRAITGALTLRVRC